MKKNISINICGTIYSIDEDAYQLLEHYLDSMKRYFSQEGDEDIADDIEHRVAELLWNKKHNGNEAVTIEMVKEIIEKIGNPADIADEATSHDELANEAEQRENNDASAEEDGQNDNDFQQRFNEFANEAGKKADKAYNNVKSRISNRKFYRCGKNKVIGGVCAGCAEYFGGDPVVWRLGVIILTLIFNSSFYHWWSINLLNSFIPIMYFILWMIVPEAKTPEDKIRMKGQEVTPETLKEQIVSDMEEKNPQQPVVNNNGSGCLKIIFGALMVITLFPLVAILIAIITFLLAMLSVAVGVSTTLFSVLPVSCLLPGAINSCSSALWIGLVAGLLVVGLPIYAIIRALRNNEKNMSSASIVILIITWITALAISVIALSYSTIKVADYFNTHDKKIEINFDNDDQQIAEDSLFDSHAIHNDSI